MVSGGPARSFVGGPGSERLIKKMLRGPLDGEFVVARPGETISYLDFKRAEWAA